MFDDKKLKTFIKAVRSSFPMYFRYLQTLGNICFSLTLVYRNENMVPWETWLCLHILKILLKVSNSEYLYS